MPKTIKHGTYRHYKGNLYCVLGLGHHTETLEELVFYVDTYDPTKLWARPTTMFTETVVVDGNKVPRFTYLGE